MVLSKFGTSDNLASTWQAQSVIIIFVITNRKEENYDTQPSAMAHPFVMMPSKMIGR